MGSGSEVTVDDDDEIETIVLNLLASRQVETDEVPKAIQVRQQNLEYVR